MDMERRCEINYDEKLYKIGLFAQMNKVTVKTLRHYDEIGLLKPEKVDAWSGYRYYTSGQLPILHQIIALQQMGMSLEEIKMIRQGLPVEEFMVRKKSELLRRIAEDTVRISKIETYLSNEKELRQYNILIKELPEVIVASMRHVIKDYGEFFDIYPAMGAEMERCGCVCALPEYCFSIYHDGGYKEEDIDVEICEAVTELKEGSNGLAFKVVPRVETAACALHKGAYEDFPQAYAALMRWMEDNGYEPNGYPRESYIDGIWNKESSSEWLTEIQFPVRKI